MGRNNPAHVRPQKPGFWDWVADHPRTVGLFILLFIIGFAMSLVAYQRCYLPGEDLKKLREHIDENGPKADAALKKAMEDTAERLRVSREAFEKLATVETEAVVSQAETHVGSITSSSTAATDAMSRAENTLSVYHTAWVEYQRRNSK